MPPLPSASSATRQQDVGFGGREDGVEPAPCAGSRRASPAPPLSRETGGRLWATKARCTPITCLIDQPANIPAAISVPRLRRRMGDFAAFPL